jgi:uncharacterized protein (TIGR02217 family)
MLFHEIRFPTNISRGATGGPERRTDVITLSSGYEERNSRWADSRRSYNAGYGVRGLDDMNAVLGFFEERRAQLYGFRWKDYADFRSGPPSTPPAAADQMVATGDGSTATFQLIKTYGSQFAPYARIINKPVQGTLLLAVAGTVRVEGMAFTIDDTTGLITFSAGSIPAAGAAITAGYEFDVPVRFNTDQLEVNVQNFMAGSIPHIPIVEIKL